MLKKLKLLLNIVDKTRQLIHYTKARWDEGLMDGANMNAFPGIEQDVSFFYARLVDLCISNLGAINTLLKKGDSQSVLNTITLSKRYARDNFNAIDFEKMEIVFTAYEALATMWKHERPDEFDSFVVYSVHFEDLKNYPFKNIFTYFLNLIEDDPEDRAKILKLLMD